MQLIARCRRSCPCRGARPGAAPAPPGGGEEGEAPDEGVWEGKERQGKGREGEGKGREGKGREGKGRKGKERGTGRGSPYPILEYSLSERELCILYYAIGVYT